MRIALWTWVLLSGCMSTCATTPEPPEPVEAPELVDLEPTASDTGDADDVSLDTSTVPDGTDADGAGEVDEPGAGAQPPPQAKPRPKQKRKRKRKRRKPPQGHPPGRADAAPGAPPRAPSPDRAGEGAGGGEPPAPPPPAEPPGTDEPAAGAPSRNAPKPCPPGITRIGDTTFTVTRRLFERWKQNPYALGDAVENGKGWELRKLRRRHGYHLGMRNKDIVYEINGKKLNTKPQLLAAYLALKNKTEFELVFERNGIRRTHSFRIVEN